MSRDGGASFAAAMRLDDAVDVNWETIHSEPQLELGEDDSLLLVWTDLRVRYEDYDVRARRFTNGQAAPSISLASTDTGSRPQWRPALALRDDQALAVWQDFRTGRNELRYTSSADADRSFAADVLLHDVPSGEAFNPTVAASAERFLVVYESTASGERRVVMASP